MLLNCGVREDSLKRVPWTARRSNQSILMEISPGISLEGIMPKLSLCFFNLHAEYIMRNAGPDEAQAGNKIARRNINNLRHADDTTFMAESEEELKSLLMKVKEESQKVG